MRPDIRALIFDLDGTLADTLEDIVRAGNYALAHHGLPELPTATYRTLIGDGAAALVERIAPAKDEPLYARLLTDFRDYYLEHMRERTRAFAGIDELLAELVTRAVPMAVLSNKPQVATRPLVATLFPDIPFSAVLGQRPGVAHKPDPCGALELAALMQCSAGHCAMVGDTPTDMQTAVNAGMHPLGVSWGLRGCGELLAHGAETVFDHPRQLLDWLSDSSG